MERLRRNLREGHVLPQMCDLGENSIPRFDLSNVLGTSLNPAILGRIKFFFTENLLHSRIDFYGSEWRRLKRVWERSQGRLPFSMNQHFLFLFYD